MPANRDKLQFYSEDVIDKIVAPKVRRTISNNGNTSGSWQSSRIVVANYTNPYGKRCFVRGRWSIDGGENWYTFDSHQRNSFKIVFTGSSPLPPSQNSAGLLAAVSIGVSDTQVRIVTANGDHGNVTINISNNNQSYSPTSHTFLVEYELFEVE